MPVTVTVRVSMTVAWMLTWMSRWRTNDTAGLALITASGIRVTGSDDLPTHRQNHDATVSDSGDGHGRQTSSHSGSSHGPHGPPPDHWPGVSVAERDIDFQV